MAEFSWIEINRCTCEGERGELGKKHIAVICAPDSVPAHEPFDLAVKVGEIPHPNENAHHIQFFEVLVDDVYAGRVDFIPVVSEYEATLKMKLGYKGKCELQVRTRCNLHGVWEGSKEIEIT